jgi:hypothetical protein
VGKIVGKSFSIRMLLLQPRVLGFGLLQDGEVGVGVVPDCDATHALLILAQLMALPEPARSEQRR